MPPHTTNRRSRFFWTDVALDVGVEPCPVPGYVLLRLVTAGGEPLDIAARAGDLLNAVLEALGPGEPLPEPSSADPDGFGGGGFGLDDTATLSAAIVFDIDRAVHWGFTHIPDSTQVRLTVHQPAHDGRSSAVIGIDIIPALLAEAIDHVRNTDSLEM